MTGKDLRDILSKTGLQWVEIARRLDMSVQNLQNKLETTDIKTGLLEKICAVLDMDITDFIKSNRVDNTTLPISNTATREDKLLAVIHQQSAQLSKSQQQITDLIEIIKRK